MDFLNKLGRTNSVDRKDGIKNKVKAVAALNQFQEGINIESGATLDKFMDKSGKKLNISLKGMTQEKQKSTLLESLKKGNDRDVKNHGLSMYSQTVMNQTPKAASIKPLLHKDMEVDVVDYRTKPLSLTYRSSFMPYSHNIHTRNQSENRAIGNMGVRNLTHTVHDPMSSTVAHGQ